MRVWRPVLTAAIAALASVWVSTALAGSPQYVVKDLGADPSCVVIGGDPEVQAGWSGGAAINNAGVGVGWTTYGACDNTVRGLPNVGSVPPGNSWGDSAIGDSGLIVGWEAFGGGRDLTNLGFFFPTFPGAHAWLFNPAGGTIDLGSFYGPSSPTDLFNPDKQAVATGINDAAQAVGASTAPWLLFQGTFGTVIGYHAFRYQGGVMTDLGALGGGLDSAAFAINARGQVVGVSETALPSTQSGSPPPGFCLRDTSLCFGLQPGSHAFIWSNGSMRDLGTLGGSTSIATAINDTEQVVGSSTIAGDGAFHGFLWDHGTKTDLGPATTTANAINRFGQIVGDPAFVYADGIVKNLNSLIEPSFHLVTVNGINDKGQIIGTAQTGGTKHAVILTDTTPPSCTLTRTGTSDQGKPFETLAIEDPLSGLQTIQLTNIENARSTTSPFTPGSPRAATVTLAKTNTGKPSRALLTVSDTAGNSGTCQQSF